MRPEGRPLQRDPRPWGPLGPMGPLGLLGGGQQLGSWRGLSKPRSGTEGRVAVAVCGCSSQIPKEWQKVRKRTGNIGFGFSGKEGGREACELKRAAREEGFCRPAPGPAPLLDNWLLPSQMLPSSHLPARNLESKESSGCGLCRGGGWHRCPSFLPGSPSPAPAPVTRHTDNTQQTHTPHTCTPCSQCLEQCEEQRPCSLSGIKLDTEGHVMGTEVVRSSGVRAEELRWGAFFILEKILILNISFLIGWSEHSYLEAHSDW